jgi:gamma-glutamyl hercynylcysteine S-oxide synthase
MANQLTAHPATARPGWASRLFRSFSGSGGSDSAPRPQAAGEGSVASTGRVRGMARQLVGDDRYVFVLLKEAAENIAEHDASLAWTAMGEHMALIPSGVVPVVHANGGIGPVDVAAFYLDRHAVTNRQFHRFVHAAGYDTLEIWPQEVWPSLMKFVDRTRKPGPREWQDGKFPAGQADHPVVGVSWYEAAAYAAWCGKRLPIAPEWQKAGGWPEHFSGGACSRYPWGDVYEPARANLGSTGAGQAVPVNEYPGGATPNGIYQMTGNVWEWLADRLDAIPCRPDESFAPARPMRRIIGGAFDTYFHAEATCQFITGQPELDRRENIGFRCVVPVSRLRPRP